MILVTTAEAGRALGPMLPASARERWPFFVLNDSCLAALPDQPGLPWFGSVRWNGGSHHHASPHRLTTDSYDVGTDGASLCCAGVPLSTLKQVAQTARSHACTEMTLSLSCLRHLSACRWCAVHLRRPRGYQQEYSRYGRRLVRARAKCVFLSLKIEPGISCSSRRVSREA
jgi:hypothetical protein